jgi:hypothetical protein
MVINGGVIAIDCNVNCNNANSLNCNYLGTLDGTTITRSCPPSLVNGTPTCIPTTYNEPQKY